jgi:hypothetical protein
MRWPCGRTGRGAVALPGVYCQQWPSQGTGTQTPCGPNFQTQPVAPSAGTQQQTPQESEAEQRLRVELLRRSLGFGGIFGPALQDWVNTPSLPDECGGYSDPAACRAYKAGDGWAARRLQDPACLRR